MVWGRKRQESEKSEALPRAWEMPRAAGAVAVFGALACVLFLCAASVGWTNTAAYPAELSRAAVQTFLAEHTAFADAIGLDEYFPGSAVLVGTFSSRGEEAYRAYVEEGQREWTFRDYLRDAFQTLLGVT